MWDGIVAIAEGWEAVFALLVLVVGAISIGEAYLGPVVLWIYARASGVRVTHGRLRWLRFQGLAPRKVVRPLVRARRAGFPLDTLDMERHLMAGGDPEKVADALMEADRAGLSVTFEQAAALDLIGRDPVTEIRALIEQGSEMEDEKAPA